MNIGFVYEVYRLAEGSADKMEPFNPLGCLQVVIGMSYEAYNTLIFRGELPTKGKIFDYVIDDLPITYADYYEMSSEDFVARCKERADELQKQYPELEERR